MLTSTLLTSTLLTATLLAGSASAASYGPQLEGFAYPHQIQRYSFASQG
jgi:hypothetical protein